MKTKGFTLIELLAAIAIIGLLALITVPNVIEKYNSSKLGAMIIQENKLVESGDILVNDYCKDPINKDYQSKCGIYYKQVLDDFDELIITDKDGKVVDKSHDGKKYYRNYICVKDIKTQGYYSENLNYSGEECSGVVIYKMDYETDLQVDSYSYVVCGEEYASNVETGITKGMFSECFPADTPGGGGDTIPVEKKYKLKVTFTENTPYGMEVSDEVHKQLKKGESINIDVPKYIDWSGNLYTAFIHSYNPSIKNLLEISNGKLKGYMPEEDLEVHIVYSIKKHTLTINFIEFQTNKKMDNSISVEVFNLEPYLVNPKKIDNYKVITPNLEFKIDDNKDASKDVVYQKINFNLTYDEEGGTSCTDGKVPYLGAYPTLCTTTRVGYKFKGWYLGDDGTGTKIKAGDKHNEYKDVTLHARWEPNTYTVTYNCNGGKGSMDSSPHEYGTASALSVNGCDKVGYKFVYWNTKADGTGNRYTDKQKVSTLTSQDKGVVNLYAIYEPRDDTKYTVKHYTQNPNDDGYSLNKTETFQGTTATKVTPSTISITGMIAPSKKSITINPAGDSVLEYKYTRKTYTFNITKNNTYGTISPNSLTLRHGVTFTTSGNKLNLSNGNIVTASPASVTGYDTSFTGWSKTSGSITSSSSVEAKFKGTIKKYTVTFKVNNSSYGTVSSSSITVNHGTTYSVSGGTITFSDGQKVTASVTAATGYTTSFSKWSSTSGEITGTTTLTANFTRNIKTYIVTLKVNDSSYGKVSLASVTVNHGTTYSVSGGTLTFSDGQKVTASVIDKTGYTTSFSKWSSTSGTITGATTLTANFTRNIKTYVVTLKVNDSSYGKVSLASVTVNHGTTYSVSGGTLTFGDGQKVTASVTEKTGYTTSFNKWSSTSGEITGTTTLTANFTRNIKTYVVTLKVNDSSYGTVSKSSVTVNHGTAYSVSGGTLTFSDGQKVTASVTDKTGYTTSFSKWSSTSGTVTSATTLTASFTRSVKSYAVTISVNNSTYGSVSTSSVTVPYGTTYSTSGKTLTFDNGSKVTASTKKAGGVDSIFESWSSTSGTITGAKTITANFKSGDTKNPSCSLAISDGKIKISTSDDVGVVGTGLSQAGAPIYNGVTYVDLTTGTFFGYVKDAAGKTGNCHITVTATSKYCQSEYTLSGNTCAKWLSYLDASCTITNSGNCLCRRAGNHAAVVGYCVATNKCKCPAADQEVMSSDCVTKTECTACSSGTKSGSSCYSYKTPVINCSTGYTKYNDSYCYQRSS